MLTSPSIFRPAVVVGEGGFLYVTFDASDITALPGARCVSISYTPRTGGSSTDAPAGTAPPAAGSPSTSGGGAPPAASAAAGSANAAGGGNGNALPHLLPRKSASGNTPSVPSTGGLLMPGSNPAVVTVAAAAAAAALQRGRLLTNDADLDTLLYVVADQDASPLFRASVSATNTAKSRVVAHAPGGIAAAGPTPGGARGLKLPPPKNVIVVAVADDASCPLAVRRGPQVLSIKAVRLAVGCVLACHVLSGNGLHSPPPPAHLFPASLPDHLPCTATRAGACGHGRDEARRGLHPPAGHRQGRLTHGDADAQGAYGALRDHGVRHAR